MKRYYNSIKTFCVFFLILFAPLLGFTQSTCISWQNGTPASDVRDAMERLCEVDIISSNQNTAILNNPITKIEVAQCLKRSLFGSDTGVLSFLDNFPNVFPDLETYTSVQDKRNLKLMLYLEYKNQSTNGLDNISPFSREYVYSNLPDVVITKSDAIKAMLEAWNLTPSMLYYDPSGLFTNSPIICDMRVSNKNLGWVQRANVLGLLTGIIGTQCSPPNNINFGTDGYITYSEFYRILARLIQQSKPQVKYDDFFIPNLFYIDNQGKSIDIEKGVFNEYADNSFAIPGGGLPLNFQHSYHSNFTEVPLKSFENIYEKKVLPAKLEPLGGGWTHTYSSFIKTYNENVPGKKRLLIYWSDGAIDSYSVTDGKYETKSITDKLTINSTVGSTPSDVTIQKGRIQYHFSLIDNQSFYTLHLVNITDAYNNSLLLEYEDGYTEVIGYTPKRLKRVFDTYSNRSLFFTYQINTNYLQSVTDPLNRTITFFVNQFTHSLDSFADAKNQMTRYYYFEENGTFAYRTHLLHRIQKPNGNYIDNTYLSRKLKQTKTNSYTIQVDAVPNYSQPWTQQQSQVTTTQNSQTINTNYTFDGSGNIINISTPTENIKMEFDSENRLLVERDIDRGFIKRYEYDANGYLSKNVSVDSFYNDSLKYEYINNPFGEPITIRDFNEQNGGVRETKIYRNTQGSPVDVVENEGTGGEIRHTFWYSERGVLTEYKTPSRLLTVLEHNNFGNFSRTTTYPLFGNLTPIVEEYTYDNASRLKTHTDKNGVVNSFDYDNNDNATVSVVDVGGLNLTTVNTFDRNDNTISILSPRGHLTMLRYDIYTDDLIEENDGINKKTWAYNENGTLKTFTNKNNEVFNYTYYDNSKPKLKGMLYGDGTTFYTYWENTRNLNYINNSKTAKSNWFRYYNHNRGKWNKVDLVNTQGFFSGSTPDNVAYSYDRLGRPEYIGYPSFGGLDLAVGYYYDFITKQLSLVERQGNFKTYARYTYDIEGKPRTEIYGNGDTTFYHYDGLNRLDSLWVINKHGQLLYSIGASLDNKGKHTGENLRLFYQGQEITSQPNFIDDEITSYNYEQRNRITTGGNQSYTHDDAGNILTSAQPIRNYTWNNYGQLTGTTFLGNATTYEYDALGYRRRNNDIYYVLDQQNSNGNVLIEARQNTTPISAYIWGNGLVARVDPVTDSTFYYHFDFRGSIIAITNENGDIVQYYKYDEFGNIYDKQGTIAWTNSHTYIGKYGVQLDSTGLYYMGARYYNPRLGRFISEDPVWHTNLYSYADNDPINKIDPEGRDADPWTLSGQWDGLKESINQGRPLEAGLYTLALYGSLATTALDIISLGEGSVVKNVVKKEAKKIIYSNVDKLIDKAGNLYKTSTGALQGFVNGNAKDIYNSLIKNGQLIRDDLYKLKDGTYINFHYSRETGISTIDINKNGTIYKIRINE
ncbi:MAG: hypothetical protein K1X55_10235 [Chitinophagales bacterium]|nr:hypothetical protein [Chitinophagales bacterium]